MAKSLKELIDWYKAPETRSWRRKFDFSQMIVMSLLSSISILVLYHYGNGKWDGLFYPFAFLISISSVALAPAMLNDLTMSRWFRMNLCLLSASAGCLMAAYGMSITLLQKFA